jgi:predicted RNase H-like HicB family nuclease
MTSAWNRRYTVVLTSDPDGGYVVSVPALPGCVTQGETVDEAMAMARDAIEGYLAVLEEDGEPLPADIVEAPRIALVEV